MENLFWYSLIITVLSFVWCVINFTCAFEKGLHGAYVLIHILTGVITSIGTICTVIFGVIWALQANGIL